MKKSNPSKQRQTFVDAMKSGNPVTFSKINKGSRGCYFFNSYHGSSMSDAVASLHFKPSDNKPTTISCVNEKTLCLSMSDFQQLKPSLTTPNDFVTVF